MTTPAARKSKRKPALPKLIEKYYADPKDLAHQNVMYEMGTRPAFHALLAAAGKDAGCARRAAIVTVTSSIAIAAEQQDKPRPGDRKANDPADTCPAAETTEVTS